MTKSFDIGTTRVKPHKFGNWIIEEFSVSESEAKYHNFGMALNGVDELKITAGSYIRLIRKSDDCVVMSNTPMECASNLVAYENAHGSVLIAGLGMGMILEAILSKPDVSKVRIIEIDKDIIDYVGSFFKEDHRVEIIQGDVASYFPNQDEWYDYIWIDIWDYICAGNLEAFEELNYRFHKHCNKMNMWSMDLLDCDPEDYYKIAM